MPRSERSYRYKKMGDLSRLKPISLSWCGYSGTEYLPGTTLRNVKKPVGLGVPMAVRWGLEISATVTRFTASAGIIRPLMSPGTTAGGVTGAGSAVLSFVHALSAMVAPGRTRKKG